MLSRISSKKVRDDRYRNYYVRVPAEWAERMELRGAVHVTIDEVGAKGVLVLSPVGPAQLEAMRAARRRASRKLRVASAR